MLRRRILIALTGALVLALAAPASQSYAQKRGGVLNWFAYGDPARLDVFVENALISQQAVAGVFSGLLQDSPDDPSQIVPDLATSYDVSNKGKTYTFHLRKGVKWHDGKPFTSADVKATTDHIFDPQTKSTRCGPMLAPMVDKVTVVDDFTVRFDLKFAAAPFIPSVASAWCRIAAKHILERDGNLQQAKSQIGTGPFRLKRYERGSIIEWERNPDYYDPKLPYLDGLKQYILVGSARQLAAAKAGQIDAWDSWPPMDRSQWEELKAARGDSVVTYRWPINTLWAVHLNTVKPPFDNADMRKAVHLALDRQQLVEKGLEGAGTPCAILDPKLYGEYALPLDEVMKMPGCRPDKAADIAEAKKLVAKHFPNGVDIDVETRQVGNYVDRTQVVVAQLAKIGIRGKIRQLESAVGYAAYAKGDFTMIASQDNAMFLSDPSGIFSLLYIKTGGRNWVKWVDPKIDQWAEDALAEQVPAKRAAIYHKMQRLLLTEDTATVPVAWVEGWFFYDKKVKNFRSGNTVYDNNTFMKVWLEK